MMDYTIVIPTYRRPADLRRLLRFLTGCNASVPIVVLDSSSGAEAAANAKTVASMPSVRREGYPDTTPFYDKLADGVARFVLTPATVLCADDDLVLPEAIERATAVLQEKPDLAVAHGFYAHFSMNRGATITQLGYHGGDIRHADPMVRVAEGLLSYEATLYGVHRTEILRRVLDEAKLAPNLFSAEILTAVLALALGGMCRLPEFSHLRNNAPSQSARHWHPAELLAVEPATLVAGLAYVRTRLAAVLPDVGEARLRLYDHAALAYLSDYIRPDAARRIAQAALHGAGEPELKALGWAEFAVMLQSSSWLARLRRNPVVRRLKEGPLRHVPVKHLLLRAVGGRRPLRHVNRSVSGGDDIAIALDRDFCRRLEDVALSTAAAEVRMLTKALTEYRNQSALDE